MSDSSSDEYHEDSLPDLVLSSSYPREEISRFYAREDVSGYLETREDEDEDEERGESINYSLPPDLLCGEEQLNLEQEYFASGDQVFFISQKDFSLQKRGVCLIHKSTYTNFLRSIMRKMLNSNNFSIVSLASLIIQSLKGYRCEKDM